MRSPRRPIGAGGWFLRAYAAGFGAVFGVMSAVLVGGIAYAVVAGAATLLMSSDGTIELNLAGGNHSVAPSPQTIAPPGQLTQYPMASLEPYQVPQSYGSGNAYASEPSPAMCVPSNPAAPPSPVAPLPYSSTPRATALVPVESPVEAAVSHEEPVADDATDASEADGESVGGEEAVEEEAVDEVAVDADPATLEDDPFSLD